MKVKSKRTFPVTSSETQVELVRAGQSKPREKQKWVKFTSNFCRFAGFILPFPTNSLWASEDVLITANGFMKLISEE